MPLALEPADRDEWFAVANAAPAATFFHTPYWADIAVATAEWEDATVLARLPDGARAIYPLIAAPRRRLVRLARARSTWAGCYGGPIAERALTPEEVEALHAAVAARHPVELRVVLGPAMAGQRLPSGFEATADTTHVVDLTDDFEAVFARIDRKQRASWRRGEEVGIVTRPAESRDDHRAYEELYEETLSLRGERSTSRYPPAVLRAMADLVENHPGVGHMWLAEYEGRAAAAMYGFRWHGHFVLWHAATRELRLKIASPMVTLFIEMMRDASSRGASQFDMNPSGGHAGVASFKRRLGAQELPVRRIVSSRRWAAAALSATNRVDRIRRTVR